MTMSRALCRAVAALTLGWAAWAAAADGTFGVRLATTPIDRSLQASVTGHGSAEAELDGRELSVEGAFEGLAVPATGASLHVGAATGVRGPAVAELEVDHAAQGSVTGRVRLSRADAAALAEGRMYLQIDSEAAPDGNLWGWLLP